MTVFQVFDFQVKIYNNIQRVSFFQFLPVCLSVCCLFSLSLSLYIYICIYIYSISFNWYYLLLSFLVKNETIIYFYRSILLSDSQVFI